MTTEQENSDVAARTDENQASDIYAELDSAIWKLTNSIIRYKTKKEATALEEVVMALARVPTEVNDHTLRLCSDLILTQSTRKKELARAIKAATEEMNIEWEPVIFMETPEIHDMYEEEPEFLSDAEIADSCYMYLKMEDQWIPSMMFVRVLMRRFEQHHSRKKKSADHSREVDWIAKVWGLSIGDAQMRVAKRYGKVQDSWARVDRRNRKKVKTLPTGPNDPKMSSIDD